jgi:hypothetical protein
MGGSSLLAVSPLIQIFHLDSRLGGKHTISILCWGRDRSLGTLDTHMLVLGHPVHDAVADSPRGPSCAGRVPFGDPALRCGGGRAVGKADKGRRRERRVGGEEFAAAGAAIQTLAALVLLHHDAHLAVLVEGYGGGVEARGVEPLRLRRGVWRDEVVLIVTWQVSLLLLVKLLLLLLLLLLVVVLLLLLGARACFYALLLRFSQNVVLRC